MKVDAEGSITNDQGDVLQFSREAFVKLAKDTNRCFVCGKHRSETTFDDEHVIPDWLLRRFKLHSRRITLPNGYEPIYGRYTLRCCQGCNRLLGRKIEEPISAMFQDDLHATAQALMGAGTLFYQWLCLLYIKLHLKDREIQVDPRQDKDSGRIGDIYDWDALHHIHCVARAAHSNVSIDPAVPGTNVIFEMRPEREPFDFGSISWFSTVMVRIGNVGIASVLNDCGHVAPLIQKYLAPTVGHPLSPIQLREVTARLAYGNKLLTNRPAFWTEQDGGSGLSIRARAPAPGPIGDVVRAELGALIAYSCGRLMDPKLPETEEVLSRVRRGEAQFLYRDDGSFIQN